MAETTEANNFESTDTKEISDIKIEEAPKQEINIGIVCAIIGAVLLLLLVILIFAVRKFFVLQKKQKANIMNFVKIK